ncbi:MAG: hypothetical protein ACR2HZ_01355 [Gemmatimonadaceae bacterium]
MRTAIPAAVAAGLLTCATASVAAQDIRLHKLRTLIADTGDLRRERVRDVAVGGDGRISVLYGRKVLTFASDTTRRVDTIGSGKPTGAFVDAVGLAYGRDNTLYVFDRKLNAIAVFDSSGRFVRRVIVPLELSFLRQMVIDSDGTIIIAAFASDFPTAQIHLLCPAIDCHVRSSGSSRPTKDSLAFAFFQSGPIALERGSVILAHINPFWIERIDLSTGGATTLVRSDDLPDGEPIAVGYTDGRLRLVNRFPQTTGIVRDDLGRWLVSGFSPDSVRSFIALYSASGNLLAKASIPGYFAVKAILSNQKILVLRQVGSLELVEYRLTIDSDER